jgi:hypothetical protein
MGQAKQRGTKEQRIQQAISAGRTKKQVYEVKTPRFDLSMIDDFCRFYKQAFTNKL